MQGSSAPSSSLITCAYAARNNILATAICRHNTDDDIDFVIIILVLVWLLLVNSGYLLIAKVIQYSIWWCWDLNSGAGRTHTHNRGRLGATMNSKGKGRHSQEAFVGSPYNYVRAGCVFYGHFLVLCYDLRLSITVTRPPGPTVVM